MTVAYLFIIIIIIIIFFFFFLIIIIIIIIIIILTYCLFDLDSNCHLTVCSCRFTTQSARNERDEIED